MVNTWVECTIAFLSCMEVFLWPSRQLRVGVRPTCSNECHYTKLLPKRGLVQAGILPALLLLLSILYDIYFNEFLRKKEQRIEKVMPVKNKHLSGYYMQLDIIEPPAARCGQPLLDDTLEPWRSSWNVSESYCGICADYNFLAQPHIWWADPRLTGKMETLLALYIGSFLTGSWISKFRKVELDGGQKLWVMEKVVGFIICGLLF